MFKADFDGMHHREQIKDYIREVELDERGNVRGSSKSIKAIILSAAVAGVLALLWSLANAGQVLGQIGLLIGSR